METNPTFFFLLLLFLLALTHAAGAASNDTATAAACVGSIAECNQDVEMEMEMESEISRRLLQQKKYISPGALKRDQPVCNGGAPGQPYSRGGGCIPEPSNPYHRGCSRYYKCRGDQ